MPVFLPPAHPSRELLQRFGSGALSGPELDAIQGHLVTCTVCSEWLSDQTRPPQANYDPVKEATYTHSPAASPPSEKLGADLPERVGRYRLEHEIARGGMGQVVRVTDEVFRRQLAMKIALGAGQTSQDSLDRFVREALVTGQLQHPGVPPVQEMGQLDDGRPYFIMKLIQGSDLKDLLRERSSTGADLPRFVAIFGQICQTLGYAHSHGIIHRDLKPANIMVGAFGEVQVMDWGLAKLLTPNRGTLATTSVVPGLSFVGQGSGSQGVSSLSTEHGPRSADPQLTAAGTVMGTSAYMAPEQARGEIEAMDARCDVFGLGGILCEILTGTPPFAAPTVFQNVLLAMNGDLTDTMARLDACEADAELVKLAKRCLAPDRENRPAHGGVVAEEVAHYQAALQERMQQAEIDKAAVLVKVREERKRRRVSLALAAAVVMLIVGSGAGALWYRGEMARQDADRLQQAADKLRQDDEKRRQESELAMRRAYLNKEISNAVADAEQRRLDLLTRLANQSTLNEWLSDIDQWQRALQEAQVAWRRAKLLADGSPELVEAALAERLRKLEDKLRADDKNWDFGKACDDTRLAAATLVAGNWDPWATAKKYPGIFAGLGDIMQGDAGTIVAQINKSPIRLVYLAALDDWANLVDNDPQLRARLFSIANELDTDAWRKEFRQVRVWNDEKALQALADKVDLQEQSPQILVALSMRLAKSGAGARLLRKALSKHPRDFWMFFVLGVQLTDPVEREGCYRAALAIRPLSGSAHVNLGLALCDRNDYEGGGEQFRQALAINSNLATAHINLARVLEHKNDLEGAIKSLREGLAINPNLAWARNNLGTFLIKKKDVEGAIAQFREAIAIEPEFAVAHYNLGNALRDKEDLEGAITHYRLALDANPNYVEVHVNLGNALRAKKDVEGAIEHFHKALDIDVDFAKAHYSLGLVLLLEKKDMEGAIKHFQRTVASDPGFAGGHLYLGKALINSKKDVEGAIKHLRIALDIDPNLADARLSLGLVQGALGNSLLTKGKYAEARAATLECQKLLPADHPQQKPMLQQLQRCDQMLALDRQLSVILQGADPPDDSASLLALAQLCLTQKHYFAAAARFYAGALEKDATLADSLSKKVRFAAACAAVLAASGKGNDAGQLQDQDRTKLRRQALDWLRADLAIGRKQIQSDNVHELVLLTHALSYWPRYVDLVSVRDAKELAGLPKEEQEAWRQLWTEAAQLLKEVKARFIETRQQGTLTAKQTEQVHDVKMLAGRTYVIDLESAQFNAYLRLEDAKGKVLAENDDISLQDKNSRLIFSLKQAGVYRVVATSFQQQGTGTYTLTIREFAGPLAAKDGPPKSP